ncbi:uncharacterized protein LOC115210299, partial [Argonauta hians]
NFLFWITKQEVAISVTVVLLILVLIIIIITRNRNKTQIFRCLSHPYQRARQSSQVGLSFANEEEEEEKEAPHETVVPEMIAPNDEGYFYDEIFDRSAFTDQSTHHSISNLFTITDYDDNPEQFSADFEGRF